MTEQRKDFPEFYLTRPLPCPYLPNRQERKLFTHLWADKSLDKLQNRFDYLHAQGFRRSQTIAYRPHCENCNACVSVRIRVDEFCRSKSQKRIWRQNEDLSANRADAFSDAEQYALFKTYVKARHKDGGMADMSLFDYQAMIEESVVESFLREYRLPGGNSSSEEESERRLAKSQLMGVALCDQLSDGISLVYSFFDPMERARSLGSYIILETIDYAKALGLPFVYLGYWIKGSSKMDYKIRFLPQDHLIEGDWVPFQEPSE